MTAQDIWQDALGGLNLIVLAATGVVVFIYTRAAQRSNEIQEQPLLNFIFKDNRNTGGSRLGSISIKNIGKGPAYNISFEAFKLKGYRYKFFLETPMLESLQEVKPRAVVKTPDGGTEAFDQNLMWLLSRMMPESFNQEAIDAALQNPVIFLAHYQGTNGKTYYSAFVLYCNLPPVGDILMHFVAHGSGVFLMEQVKELWLKSRKVGSPFMDGE